MYSITALEDCDLAATGSVYIEDNKSIYIYASNVGLYAIF